MRKISSGSWDLREIWQLGSLCHISSGSRIGDSEEVQFGDALLVSYLADFQGCENDTWRCGSFAIETFLRHVENLLPAGATKLNGLAANIQYINFWVRLGCTEVDGPTGDNLD